jgi:hypothetical protein
VVVVQRVVAMVVVEVTVTGGWLHSLVVVLVLPVAVQVAAML